MRPEFYQFYTDMYEKFEHHPRYPVRSDLVDRTREAIEVASRNIDVPVRPDAKCFLLLNFYQMVLLPISLIGAEGPGWSDLNSDIGVILGHAKTLRQQKAGGQSSADVQEKKIEISGGDVIEAIGQTWDKIRYNHYLYWT
jgi:hypothetical protein